MKPAPALLRTSREPAEHAAQGGTLVLRALRYLPGQDLCILNPDTGAHTTVTITAVKAGPISLLTSAQMIKSGYRSRGEVLDAREAATGDMQSGIGGWVTFMTWE